tara:strand:+ start:8925 stop:9449 length:525 start_codon:yes stop_codon:yes gene_type:complete
MSIRIPKNEEVVYEVRRHWYMLFTEIITLVGFFILVTGLIIVFGSDIFGEGSASIQMFLIAALAVFLWPILFIFWVNYYLDIWIITNRRVYDIEQHSLFTRDISEFRLEKVQDITIEVRGIVATFLNFGDLHVQTAGTTRDFVLRKIRKPYEARTKLSYQLDLMRTRRMTNNTI